MMKAASMLAGLSLAPNDTSTLGGMPVPAKARRNKAAFVKSAIPPPAQSTKAKRQEQTEEKQK